LQGLLTVQSDGMLYNPVSNALRRAMAKQAEFKF
jgi:hypothetical protein